MWAFAWQNLITRPTRTALAVVGLTIPVLAFLGLFSITRGIRDLMGSTLDSMQGLMVLRENAPAPAFSDLPADVVDTLKGMRGVKTVAPEVWRIAPSIDGKGGVASTAIAMLTKSKEQGVRSLINTIMVEGMDIPEHLKLRSLIFARSLLPKEQGGGRFLNPDDAGEPNVVISKKIAADFPNPDGKPKEVGQSLKIGGKEFQIVGIYETGSLVLDVTIVMDIGVARDLLGVSEDTVSSVNVEPLNAADTDDLARRITESMEGVRAQRISQFNLTVRDIMGKLDMFLLAAVSLALLVGGVGIANTMLMSTSERYVEFGVMRTNGWTRRNVLSLVTAESALLGLLSGAAGAVLAAIGVTAANRLLTGFTLDLSPWLLLFSLAVALSIATASGLYPAWKASRMTPMDAIRHNAA